MNAQDNQWAQAANPRERQMLAMINELREEVKSLRSSRTRARQVLPEPERFSGRAEDWDTWAMTMQAKLRIDKDAIGNEEAQFYYVYSSLDSRVQGLILNFVRHSQEQEEWRPEALLDQLNRIYEDPNKVKKAGQKLMELRQGTMAVASYVPQFEKALYEARAGNWPDDAKITTLVGGLNKNTRQRIDHQVSTPTDYNGFVRMLQALGSKFGTSYESESNAMEWEPVTLSPVKTAPSVTMEQRQQWRAQGKCVRCGSGKHWVKDCKMRATRSRSSSASSRNSDPIGVMTMTMAGATRRRTTAKPSFVNEHGEPVNKDRDL